MKQILGIIFYLIISTKLIAQDEIRKDILQITNKIEKGIVENGYIGEPPRPSKQFLNFIDLKNKASISELYQLCNDPSPTVRCYSFWGLAYYDKSDGIINILINHLNDNTIVNVMFGDVMWTQSVGDFYYDVLRPKYIDSNVRKLSAFEKNKIDSILLYNKTIFNSSKDLVLINIQPELKYYDRIREIATSENNPVAVFALSKYKNRKDLNEVSDLLDNKENQYWGFRSIINFQDSSFVKKLEAFQNSEIPKDGGFNYPKLRVFYKAVASYKNKWAHDLMQNTLNHANPVAKEYHSKYIWIACKKFQIPLYSDLISQIKLSDFELSNINTEIDIE